MTVEKPNQSNYSKQSEQERTAQWTTKIFVIISWPCVVCHPRSVYLIYMIIVNSTWRPSWIRSMAVVCRYFIWALSLRFGPCRLSEFTLAGPHRRNQNNRRTRRSVSTFAAGVEVDWFELIVSSENENLRSCNWGSPSFSALITVFCTFFSRPKKRNCWKFIVFLYALHSIQ